VDNYRAIKFGVITNYDRTSQAEMVRYNAGATEQVSDTPT
jgi:hypothetical protein